jgi:hypothetical protein
MMNPLDDSVNKEALMICERFSFRVRLGGMDKIIALALQYKSWWVDRNVPIRYYVPYYATRDVIVIEYEYESLADAEKIEKEWANSEEYKELIPQWVELAERGGTAEVFEVYKV